LISPLYHDDHISDGLAQHKYNYAESGFWIGCAESAFSGVLWLYLTDHKTTGDFFFIAEMIT
jgi:hypothetical protein